MRNFIDACRELQVKKDDPEIKNYLQEQGCSFVTSERGHEPKNIWNHFVNVYMTQNCMRG